MEQQISSKLERIASICILNLIYLIHMQNISKWWIGEFKIKIAAQKNKTSEILMVPLW